MADIRLALRTLRRAPVFTAVCVLSLALGIGANTAIFSLLDQVLLRSLPVRDPGRLVVVHMSQHLPGMAMADNRESVVSNPLYRDLRDRTRKVFDGLVARASAPIAISDGGVAEPGRAELVSGNLFAVLGLRPALGRLLQPSDDGAPGASPVAVLTDAYWQKRFGRSPSVLGRTLTVNGHPMVVVGVAPASYRGLIAGSTPELFVPIAMKRQVTPTWDGLEDRAMAWLTVVGRLKPGVSRDAAQAATRTALRPILEEWIAGSPKPMSQRARDHIRKTQLDLLPAAQGVNEMRREFQGALVALMAMVGLVLLIACGNVAGLLTARAAGRRKEIAIRLAIGAGRGALVRQLLVESLLLSLAGGALGLLAASFAVKGLLAVMGSGMGDVLNSTLDLRVLGFTMALSLATGVVFGLVPALQATSARVTGALKEQAAGSISGTGPARFRQALVIGQVALSLLLLVAAGLFGRTVFNLLHVNPGFRPENVLTFQIDPTLQGYPAARTFEIYREVTRQLAALPGVASVGGANPGPLTNNSRGGNFTVEGYPASDGEEVGGAIQSAGDGYFRTIGVAVTAGREFSEEDLASGRKVALVNEAFVAKYARGRNSIGVRVTPGGGTGVVPDREIVGVVSDFAHDDLREPARPTLFLPYTQEERPDALRFYARTDRGGTDVGPAIRRLVGRIDANVAVSEMERMSGQVGDATATERLIAVLAAAFAVLATLLAAVGLYGVIAYTIVRRTAEIGVRVALGARPGDVQALVMSEVLILLGAGLAIGIPAALAASRLVRSQLFGVGASDPIVFAVASLGLGLVAIAAGAIPARRATRIDPTRALRQE